MPRELAQFGRAVRSPISAVKVQKHSVATLIRQSEGFAILVFESEVRRDLAGGCWCLRWGIRFALPECQRRGNEKEEENPTFHEGKIHDGASRYNVATGGFVFQKGAAGFTDALTIAIGERVVRAKNFLQTTGARPLIPQSTVWIKRAGAP